MKRFVFAALASVAMLVAAPAFAQTEAGHFGHPGHGPIGHPGPVGHPGGGWGHPGGGWHGPVWGHGRDWGRGWDRHHYWGFGWYWTGPGAVVVWVPGVGYVDQAVYLDPATGMYYWVDAFGVAHWLN